MIHTANTRMRDFYDIAVIDSNVAYSMEDLKAAWLATSKKRGTTDLAAVYRDILSDVRESGTMKQQWNCYVSQSYFIGDMTWEDVCRVVEHFADGLFG